MSRLIVGAFRFVDTSGCDCRHSPRRRTGEEVSAADALDQAGLPKRGYEVVKLADGSEQRQECARVGNVVVTTQDERITPFLPGEALAQARADWF